ncbi:MAG: MnmC family methyltransferase [Candidatus Woesearchaeota archaeon]|jgi:tRNA U34 5-methylaminomethyl-2-thiouridine-forming methyltransferase MnmC|nr:MnmC family methyltransferase [Candidatus Woesearchaeota archaeon]|tara:strand:- start:60268 stop:60912 length:645 start_codon:yes stop_codon:yes gene_type:complete
MKKITTKDSSITFYNEKVQDYYHSKSGAKEEAFEKHAKALNIYSKKNPVIFDVCFGLGYNTAAALDLIKGKAAIYCFENDIEILKKITEIDADFKSYNIIKKFIKNFLDNNIKIYEENNIKLVMIFGDARKKIKNIREKADFVFFDSFSPSKMPKMWTKEFFSDIREKMKQNSKLSTYSCAKFIRNNLKEAGFKVKDGPIIGRNSPGTIAINIK